MDLSVRRIFSYILCNLLASVSLFAEMSLYETPVEVKNWSAASVHGLHVSMDQAGIHLSGLSTDMPQQIICDVPMQKRNWLANNSLRLDLSCDASRHPAPLITIGLTGLDTELYLCSKPIAPAPGRQMIEVKLDHPSLWLSQGHTATFNQWTKRYVR